MVLPHSAYYNTDGAVQYRCRASRNATSVRSVHVMHINILMHCEKEKKKPNIPIHMVILYIHIHTSIKHVHIRRKSVGSI